MQSKKEFGQWLKQERQNKDFIQEDLAKELNMNRAELAAIENGTVNFPTKKIGLLSKVFNIDKEKIFQMTLKIKEQDLRKKMDEA